MGNDCVDWVRVRDIGSGSSAVVSLAFAAGSGELFAVKSAELSLSGPLQREQRILASLDCPNVVSYLGYDVTRDDNRYNIFMEYAAGGSLADEIRHGGGKLEESQIRRRTREILEGLVYLQARGIAHCDVKGQNVLIDADGRAKIGDFGCAKAIGEKGIGGTPMFMAPEVAIGEEQGPEADIWALGCTVIEMATGGAPWQGVTDEAFAVLHRIAFSDEVPETPYWFSDDARDFLRKCLVRDARARSTAAQLMEHPFVSKCLTTDENPTVRRVSPKSTLDQDIWDSIMVEESEGEEDYEEALIADPAARVAELTSSSSTATVADWTTEGGDWITVRSIVQSVGEASTHDADESPAITGDVLCVLFDFRSGDNDHESEESQEGSSLGSSSSSAAAAVVNDEVNDAARGELEHHHPISVQFNWENDDSILLPTHGTFVNRRFQFCKMPYLSKITNLFFTFIVDSYYFNFF